ncbi:alpha/beta hydrolase [Naumannella halotolerans]|uniref:alpha/beta hydrolase n=1 Tax=Naumannella halotolerans TaxID=993414 RepID=UPI0010623841|nr:alpha/beta hydrolase [Naumannella halotolerans]
MPRLRSAALSVLLTIAVLGTGSLGAVVAVGAPTLLRESLERDAGTAEPETGSSAPSAQPVPAERSPDRGESDAGNVVVPGMRDGLADLDAYRGQQLDWSACGEFRCAEVAAPLDWDLPADSAVTLALMQRPATRTPKLGTIFINPGGPGESGVALVEAFRSEGLEAYDIVGWDPRGTANSTPVRCGTDADRDALLALDESPDNEPEFDDLVEGWRNFGDLCLADSGRLLEHVSTVDTAKDLDLLRELVGDDKLNYFGYSYGTIIGQTYLELFPDRLGRIALDSVAPLPSDDTGFRTTGMGSGQVAGFDASLREFAEWCSGSPECSVEGSADGIIDRITGLLDDLDGRPLAVGGRDLSQSLAVTGIIAALYADSDQWPLLADALTAAMAGRGDALLGLADSYNGRAPNGHYAGGANAFLAINCLDAGDTGIEQARLDAESAASGSDLFGTYFGPSLACPTWPVDAVIPIRQTYPEAPPMLVIGVTGDPATPYEWTEDLAAQQPGAHLITLEGTGHTAYGRGDSCVDDAVVDYFADGDTPDGELRCS